MTVALARTQPRHEILDSDPMTGGGARETGMRRVVAGIALALGIFRGCQPLCQHVDIKAECFHRDFAAQIRPVGGEQPRLAGNETERMAGADGCPGRTPTG